jgi:hypothetical protein
MEQHRIQKYFSEEVSKQINQFAIDIVNDIADEISNDLDKLMPMPGASRNQYEKFQLIFNGARQRVLNKYGLEVSDSRTDSPYLGENPPRLIEPLV